MLSASLGERIGLIRIASVSVAAQQTLCPNACVSLGLMLAVGYRVFSSKSCSAASRVNAFRVFKACSGACKVYAFRVLKACSVACKLHAFRVLKACSGACRVYASRVSKSCSGAS